MIHNILEQMDGGEKVSGTLKRKKQKVLLKVREELDEDLGNAIVLEQVVGFYTISQSSIEIWDTELDDFIKKLKKIRKEWKHGKKDK